MGGRGRWRDPLKLEPVATEEERTQRRRMRLMGLLPVAAFVFLAAWWSFGGRMWVPAIVVPLVYVGAWVAMWRAGQLSSAHYSSRMKLRQKGYLVCPECEYDLAGQGSPGRCPECGLDHTPELLRERWERTYARLLEKPGR